MLGAGIIWLIIIVAPAGAVIYFLLARASTDRLALARLTSIAAILTLIVLGITTVVLSYTLLFSTEVGVTVPLAPTQPKLPDGVVEFHPVATVVSAGTSSANLVIAGLTLPTRLLLLGGELAGTVTLGAVAVVALQAARALRDGDIFRFAARAITTAAVIVAVGGLAWSILNDIGSWRAGVEALTSLTFGYDGPVTTGFVDSAEWLAQNGWPRPADFQVTIPFWPLGVGLGLALVGAAFRTGQGLRKDVAGLQADVDGLV
ncbi:MAG: hypothetical protein QM713_02005 [Arachnia sp.]